MKKPIPAIATRAILMYTQEVNRVEKQMLAEIADAAGVKLTEGWKLNETRTAFVKPDKKPGKPDAG